MDFKKYTGIHVLIISKDNCSYCDKAYNLAEDNELSYKKINVTDLTTKEKDDVINKTKAKTYPIIFVNEEYIGGFTEFSKQIDAITAADWAYHIDDDDDNAF